jgi:hypothetical protein
MGCEQGGKDRAKKEEEGEDVKPDLELEQVRSFIFFLPAFFPRTDKRSMDRTAN